MKLLSLNYQKTLNIMKTINIVFIIVLINLVFISCDKDEKPENPINGSYQFISISIDDVDATYMVLNDSLSFKGMSLSGQEGDYMLVLFFKSPEQNVFQYVSRYNLYGSSLKVSFVQWYLAPNYFIENNLAISPFSKQDTIYFNYTKPSENRLILTTEFSDQQYTYEFKK